MADPRDPWDDDGAAEDGGYDDGHDTFDALDFFAPTEPDTDDVDDTLREEEESGTPLFTVANPAGTITVTTFLNGSVHRVELAPTVTDMTERQLADEVLLIADLARQKAQSVLHAFLTQSMGRYGHDSAALSAGLTRGLGMPTPEQAAEAASRVFATRYAGEQD
jgi:hypothetical protein